MSLDDLAALLLRLTGYGERRIVPFPPELKAIDIGDYYGDFTRINKVLGWQPWVGLAEGLARTLEFFREHRQFYW